jgi:hypothetical protein
MRCFDQRCTDARTSRGKTNWPREHKISEIGLDNIGIRGLDGRLSLEGSSRFSCWQACTADGLGVFRGDNLDSVSHRESKGSVVMARASKRIARRAWTTQDERELKKHSKSKTPVRAISRMMRRTPGALSQKARHLGISIGHQPRRRARRR